MKNIAIVLLAGLVGSAGVASSAQANIVTNGDFEAGLAGWTVNPNSNHPWSASPGLEGALSASTGCIGAQCVDQTDPADAASLAQVLGTVAGTSYTLSFDFSPNGGTPNELKVLWDGAVIFDQADLPNTGSMVPYAVSGLLASGAATTLTFLGRQDPGYDLLDAVDVEVGSVAGAVPEPATWAMMIGGFGLIGGALRTSRRTLVFAT